MGRRTGTTARRLAALALGGLLATGLAACGDDGDGDGEDIVLEDIDGGGSESTEDTDDTTGDDEGNGTTLPDGVLAEGCSEFTEAFAALGASIGAGFGEEIDGDAVDDFQAVIDDAPEEIRDELQAYGDAFEAYADALEEAGVDFDDPSSIDPADAEQLGELTQIFSDPEFLEATEAIQEFVESGCST